MRHLKPINQKAQRIESTLENDVVALQQGGAPPTGTAHPAGLLVRVLAGLGSRQQRRHGGTVPAGGARSVRLPPHLLLAGARAGSLQLRARLDREVRVRAEGLAQDRPDLPMSRIARRSARVAGVALRRVARRSARSRQHARRPDSVGRQRHDLRRHVRATTSSCSTKRRCACATRMHTSVGIPEISLSFDRKHLYVTDPGNEKVEIIDLATKQVARHVHAVARQHEGAHEGLQPRPEGALRRAAREDVHEEARPVRGRASRRCSATTSRSTP